MDENENLGNELEDEQFNSMLSAAQKHVGASSDSGDADGDAASDNGGFPAPSPSLGVGSGKLSQAQIEAMLAINNSDTGGSDDDGGFSSTDDTGGEAEAQEMPEPEPPDEDAAIADRLREGIAAEMQASSEEAAAEAQQTEEAKKKKKEKAPKEKKEKQPIDPVVLWRGITVAAAVVAAALGFCICLLFFTDAIKSGNQDFAIKAANAVNSKLPVNTEFYVYKAYVNNGQLADECMLYGLTSFGGEDKLNIYRVVIEHDAPSIINVYYTLDTDSEEYRYMKESEDSRLRIQASQLKNHSDAIYDADREIQINSPKWEKIDCTIINRNITSVQEKR